MAVTKHDFSEEDRPEVGPGLFEDDLRPNIGELANPDEGPVVGLGGKTLIKNGDLKGEIDSVPEGSEDAESSPAEVARIEASMRQAAVDRENLLPGEERVEPEDVEEEAAKNRDNA